MVIRILVMVAGAMLFAIMLAGAIFFAITAAVVGASPVAVRYLAVQRGISS